MGKGFHIDPRFRPTGDFCVYGKASQAEPSLSPSRRWMSPLPIDLQ